MAFATSFAARPFTSGQIGCKAGISSGGLTKSGGSICQRLP
ncbi:MAG: hypothetical protein E7K72_17950 [Roseomonas mucosa]|nr:hypothetical protein [Roseomonas mucosa]